MSLGIQSRLRATVHKATVLLDRGLSNEHTPHEVAGSFGLGVLLAAMPTLGIGPLVLMGASVFSRRVSRLGVAASVVVFNPVVKPTVYAASLAIGFLVLGPVEGATLAAPTLGAAPDALLRLLIGNTILAVPAAAVGYLAALRAVNQYRGDDRGVIERIQNFLGRLGDRISAEIESLS